jgi:hypothetical protein
MRVAIVLAPGPSHTEMCSDYPEPKIRSRCRSGNAGRAMGRITGTAVLAVLVALVSATGAAAKWGIELSSTPAGLGPGDPWNVTIRIVGSHFPAKARTSAPVVRIRHAETGTVRSFKSARVARRAYEATVRFPEAGRWRYAVRYAGGQYGFEQVLIEAPAAHASGTKVGDSGAAPAQGDDDGGFPLWPVVAGSVAAVLLGALGFARLRSRRLPQWPPAPSSARTASRGP